MMLDVSVVEVTVAGAVSEVVVDKSGALKYAVLAKASADAAASSASTTTAHAARTDNPHSTTKAQVGLGNVDNTSDASKPISAATQTALDGKAPASHVGSGGAAHALATASSHGFLANTDKKKLDEIGVFLAHSDLTSGAAVKIQAAIDSLPVNGGRVYLPPGWIDIDRPLRIGDGDSSTTQSTRHGVKLIGYGAGFAVSGSSVPTVFNYVGPATTSPMISEMGRVTGVEIEGIFLACNGLCGGISATSFSGSSARNLKIVNPAPYAVGLAIFGGGAPTGNYNIFNKFEQINIALLSPHSIGLLMDGNYTVQNDTWISAFSLVRIETVAGATSAVCAWFKFVDSITFNRCHFDAKPEPTSIAAVFDATANHQFPCGMAFYDCSISSTVVYEDATHKIRENYFYGFGTNDLEAIPTHPKLVGITDTGGVFGEFLYNKSWTAYTPTVTAASGTLTTASATGRYVAFGKTVHFQIQVGITTNGTGSLAIFATLPMAARNDFMIINGMSSDLKALMCNTNGSGTALTVWRYDGAYPGGSGVSLHISGTYEAL